MRKEIRGFVQNNPILLEQCCMFAVEQKEDTYLVVSTARQAGKDNIFVEQGQEICIRGSTIEDNNFKGVIVIEQAEIKVGKVK